MRYSLLNHLVCQGCAGELVALVNTERKVDVPPDLQPDEQRVNAEGVVIGPPPAWRRETELAAMLSELSGPAGEAERACEAEVADGLLVCGECGRWYPVLGTLPELLPDHLRDWKRDRALLERLVRRIPRALARRLRDYRPRLDGRDGGAEFKHAEITIAEKVDDPDFFGPGLTSPFNAGNPEHTIHLIRSFATVLSLLGLERGGLVVDTGCGYAWTTEWLMRCGFEAIGVDICRTYLEIGLRRMRGLRPHLLVGDVENLPIAAAVADVVVGFESFHHIPDRNRAMSGFARVLAPGGRVVLAEPDGAHEHAQVSIDAMEKYGILEKGMELEDVRRYAAGSELASPEQLLVVQAPAEACDRDLAKRYPGLASNLFRIAKPGTRRSAPSPKSRAAKSRRRTR